MTNNVIERAALKDFFHYWQDRNMQKVILQNTTDNILASILIVTSDIRAVVLAELDRRGPKTKETATNE